ncbi:hypothetical protein TPHA_0F03650 [Tetrapisispora phaffii CBS 4417]|uniref:Protein DOA1 n=1 Tax=Tetrapisispora phaffii (strain ATCC 24235 / CBS 4417 / NBRC 1672 / NRRL Y-8282 / UCD 70-5) TaxID=1071381 RepID=G8BUQ9_TETPH|nr:hypothetical protein TPHA_0F03650 [Tetrapisispora phaffii CBS 4417]CCE63845.1 hypothetical protein TPHA_0F03650 [Tetrapisispora phaffii CBS 4417]
MNYKLSATLKGHTQDVRDLVTIDDNRIASVSRDGTLRVWSKTNNNQWDDGTIVYSDKNFLNSVTFDSTNNLIYFGGKDSLINAKYTNSSLDDDPIITLIGHEGNVCSLNYDEKSNLVTSGSWDMTAKVWKNGEMKGDLKGHKGSVWDSVVLSSHADSNDAHFITVSADKYVKIWNSKNVILNNFYNIHSDVIRKVLPLEDGKKFITASNDSFIKVVETETGKVLNTFSGHESFVYSIARNKHNDDELISCGEDRSVRIWSLSTGLVQQVIRLPAISIWCIDTLPNGDIIVGSSDNTIRIFTRDSTRAAEEEELQLFEESVSNSSLNANAMDFDESKLLPYDTLNLPGKKEGQLIVVKSPSTGVIEAHQYTQGKWAKIGDVVGSSNTGNDQKIEFEGKKYDYVFDVDIQEGQPPLKLPVNANDNPYILADQFLMKYDLSSTYKDQIVNFIITNTNGVALDNTAPPDPSPSAHIDDNTSRNDIINYLVLPVKEFLSISAFNPDTIFNGIVKLNAGQEKKVQFEDDLLAELGTALNDIDNGWELLLSIANRIKEDWTTKIPSFDIMRIIVTKLPEPAYLMDYVKTGLDSADIRISMLTVRMLVNAFGNEKWGLDLMASKDIKENLFETIGTNFPTATMQQASNYALSVSTLIFNYSALLSRNNNENIDLIHILSEAINNKFAKLEEYQDSEEACYRLIVAYGNMSLVEPALKSFASSVTWLNKAKSTYGTIPRFEQIFRDIGV